MFGVLRVTHRLLVFVLVPQLVLSMQALDLRQSIAPATGYPPCDALISAGFAERLLLPTSEAYEPRVESYFALNGQHHPWCFFQPRTAEEVSVAIQALMDVGGGAGEWYIAVRSGGHGPPGSNNIANGVTIDLGMMNGSWYNVDRGFASVEPGGKWKDVYYNLLHNGNVTVTGGRDGDVGVGGFLLGGGNSYFSGRNGFGCDTVVGYQVVLANGSIVEANSKENQDLWKALKGGGFNFGIVTRFDLEAMPAIDVSYGQRVVSIEYSDEVVDAMVEFADNPKERAADALVTIFIHDTLVSPEGLVLFLQANTLGDLEPSSFDTVNKIPTLEKTWGRHSMADIAAGSQVESGRLGVGSTLTFLNDATTLRQSIAMFHEHVSSLSEKFGADAFGLQIIYQPLPKHFGEIGQSKGGNVLGLDQIPSNAIMWTGALFIREGGEAALAVAQADLAALTVELKEMTMKQGTASDFVYLNYADVNRDPLGSYGPENVAFIEKVAKRYDPLGIWQKRIPGGFKISRVVA